MPMPGQTPHAAQEAAAVAIALADLKTRAEQQGFGTLTYLLSLALDEAALLAGRSAQ